MPLLIIYALIIEARHAAISRQSARVVTRYARKILLMARHAYELPFLSQPNTACPSLPRKMPRSLWRFDAAYFIRCYAAPARRLCRRYARCEMRFASAAAEVQLARAL